MSSIKLEVVRLKDNSRDLPVSYQVLYATVQTSRQLHLFEDLETLKLPAELNLNREIILYGLSPVWLYGRLVALCNDSPAPWIGCYDVRSGGIIVIHSKLINPSVGDLIPVQLDTLPCPAIFIAGQANSGKEAFSNALRAQLVEALPYQNILSYQAVWDGEGNWLDETHTPSAELTYDAKTQALEVEKTSSTISEYWHHHASVIRRLRMLTDCVLLNVSGAPQVEKQPLILECTHYIIVSDKEDAIHNWQQLCEPTLQPLVLIKSVSGAPQNITQHSPFLRVTVDPLISSNSELFPECILERVLPILEG